MCQAPLAAQNDSHDKRDMFPAFIGFGMVVTRAAKEKKSMGYKEGTCTFNSVQGRKTFL